MKRNVILIISVLLLLACNANKSEQEAADQEIGLVAGVDSNISSKIIKTADARFRVTDARRSKTEISTQIKKYGGNIVESIIESNIQQREKVKYSTDSLLEITSYSTEGRIIAQVPSEKLDEFTDMILASAEFVDHESIKFDDQSLAYQINRAKAQNRIDAIDKMNNKLASGKANNKSLTDIKDEYLDRMADNMRVDEKVKYSTLTLSFYQDNIIKKIIIGNDSLKDHRPAFKNRLVMNLLNGWVLFKEFVLMMANLWLILLVGTAIYFGFSYYRKRA